MPVTYPQRDAFFAHRFIRLLFKVCAAYQIGADGVAFLTCIAMTEDATRYRRPVSYFNEQLQSLLGFAKWERLKRVREVCIEEGWLVYIPPPLGTRKAGTYFVTIPPHADGLPDGSLDEGAPRQQYPDLGYASGDGPGDGQGGRQGDRQGDRAGGREGYREGELSDLCPIPKPIEREASPPPAEVSEEKEKPPPRPGRNIPPTLDEVLAYASEKFPKIDAEHFWNHHEATDWYRTGGVKIKDWHKAMVTWSKKEAAYSRKDRNGKANDPNEIKPFDLSGIKRKPKPDPTRPLLKDQTK